MTPGAVRYTAPGSIPAGDIVQNYNLGFNFDTGAINTKGYRYLYNSIFPGGNFLADYGPPLDYNKSNAAGAIEETRM